jgi:hypothetical protein
VQAEAGGEAADGRGAPAQEGGVGRGGEARADSDVEVRDRLPATVPSVGEAGGAYQLLKRKPSEDVVQQIRRKRHEPVPLALGQPRAAAAGPGGGGRGGA